MAAAASNLCERLVLALGPGVSTTGTGALAGWEGLISVKVGFSDDLVGLLRTALLPSNAACVLAWRSWPGIKVTGMAIS